MAVHPNGAAVQEMPNAAGERGDELPGALRGVTGEVDDGLGVQSCDAFTEVTRIFFRLTVKIDVLDSGPGGVWVIWTLLTARDAENCVACLNEAWSEVRSDMAGASDDGDSHRCSLGTCPVNLPRIDRLSFASVYFCLIMQ